LKTDITISLITVDYNEFSEKAKVDGKTGVAVDPTAPDRAGQVKRTHLPVEWH